MFLDLENYMLPCLNKKLFGVECLGCGFQRAIVFISKGEFMEALLVYPAIYTLIIMGVFVIFHQFYKFNVGKKVIMTLAIINLLIIVISYIIKIT